MQIGAIVWCSANIWPRGGSKRSLPAPLQTLTERSAVQYKRDLRISCGKSDLTCSTHTPRMRVMFVVFRSHLSDFKSGLLTEGDCRYADFVVVVRLVFCSHRCFQIYIPLSTSAKESCFQGDLSVRLNIWSTPPTGTMARQVCFSSVY